MVINEPESRFTVFWKKWDINLYGLPKDMCQESFWLIFSNFISTDKNLVFLNKRENSEESVFYNDIFNFFKWQFKI